MSDNLCLIFDAEKDFDFRKLLNVMLVCDNNFLSLYRIGKNVISFPTIVDHVSRHSIPLLKIDPKFLSKKLSSKPLECISKATRARLIFSFNVKDLNNVGIIEMNSQHRLKLVVEPVFHDHN